MDDLISRKAAIEDIRTMIPKDAQFDIKWIEMWLTQLPSAQPEQKKGEWIPAFDGKFTGGAYWFSCSKCKRIVPDVRNGGWNFCPNCGADMRGEQE